MNRFEMRVDPLTQEVYYAVPTRGFGLMQDPLLNKGHAFSQSERQELGLVGLMTESVGTLAEQVERAYEIYRMKASSLERYVTLIGLLDRNETNFYALLARHLEEMLPVVYTPTVGEACLKLSHIIRRYRGIYVTPNNVDSIERILRSVGLPNISLLVATDGERILGFGDLGADGMGIPIGKVSLYIAAAGIHPASTLPVCIDVGTENESLLADPLYLGVRQKRLRGDAYHAVIERFVQGVRRVFPRALLQWEDFGKQNAFTLLDRYSTRLPSFNDDIQGTGATAAAALRNAVKVADRPLAEQRLAIVGFGQAGSGVANAVVTMLQQEAGLTLAEARRRVWAIDIEGLLVEGARAEPNQQPFVRERAEIADWRIDKGRLPNLREVVANAGITTLVGLSAQGGIFDQALLASMLPHTKTPIVFALSNPTSCSEATPEVVMRATEGRALMATGSPFAPFVLPDGRRRIISQCNNLYVFPGMGLGAIVSGATRVTHAMFHAATTAISELVAPDDLAAGRLLPPLTDIRAASAAVALAVARQAREDGYGMRVDDERLRELVRSAMWTPRYYPYRFVPPGELV